MYRYDEFDHAFVNERVAQFRDQVARRLTGELDEDQFKPLRLQNGVYLQLHAYMLRIAVPYGTLSPKQVRHARAHRAHLRQGLRPLHHAAEPAVQLAAAEGRAGHPRRPRLRSRCTASRPRGNCIRNVTADHFAGVAADEVADPRPYAEILRQWSSLHPEFLFLPRKFKIAVTGAPVDRAAIQFHDIGYEVKRNEKGELGFAVYIGGGMGRTPMLGKKIRDFLPEEDLLAYSEAILRVYNMHGRRDNKYKARIKILVHETRHGEHRARRSRPSSRRTGTACCTCRRTRSAASPPTLRRRPTRAARRERCRSNARGSPIRPSTAGSATMSARTACRATRSSPISLKPIGGVPGDATAEQMDAVADIAER